MTHWYYDLHLDSKYIITHEVDKQISSIVNIFEGQKIIGNWKRSEQVVKEQALREEETKRKGKGGFCFLNRSHHSLP